MYVRYDASTMVIQYSSKQETEMDGTSLPTGQAGDLFGVEYWVTGKDADNYYKYPTE